MEATEEKAAHGGTRAGAGRKPTPRTTALRITRDKLGESQEGMAARIGAGYNAYTAMERQRRLPTNPDQLEKFRRLAKQQGVPLDTQQEPETGR
jgi:transcriptional regulator with XRE-family HTH domain